MSGMPSALLMQEHHLPVPRTARYCTLGPPADRAAEVWFALHGYGQLAPRFAARLAPLDRSDRLVVVPEGLSRFYVDEPRGLVGAAWMTREDRLHEIGDYVRYLDLVAAAVLAPAGQTPPIHLLGFSQGSATACRWLERGSVSPRRVIIWGGEIPPDIDWSNAEGRFRAVEFVLVAGDRDQFATEKTLATHANLLADHGVRHRIVRYPGDHSVDPTVLAKLAEGLTI
jgi:predicted esterase